MNSKKDTDTIQKLFLDPKFGLKGVDAFRTKLLTEKKINIRREQLLEILKQISASELFEKPKKSTGNSITERCIGCGYQIDLMDMSTLATRNKNFHWILTCVDVKSRYAWAVPVKRKTAALVSEAISKILKEKVPQRITTDNGSEFLNFKVKELFDKHKIEHSTNEPGDHSTMGLIERFNRTLRNLINRNFERIGKLVWVNDLNELVENYNTSYHRTIKTTPKKVWKGEKESKQKIHREQMTFLAGDTVRKIIKRKIFEKGVGQNWSKSTYEVVERDGFKYRIKNKHGDVLKSKFRENELLLTAKQDEKEEKKSSVEKQKKKIQEEKAVQKRLVKRGIDKKNIIRKPRRGNRNQN